MAGWIALHRDITNHWLFDFKHPDKYMAWTDLIMLANHEKKKFLLNGVLVECDRGELAYSQLSLADRWHWSRNKVRGFLEMLKNDGMIVQRSNHVTTIITICNYSKYQSIDKYEGTTQGTTQGTTMVQRKDSARTAQGTQTTTNNNYNNENNENKKESVREKSTPYFETVELPLFIDRELFIGWQRERKKCHPKAAQTEYAINNHISDLTELEKDGFPANSCLVFIRAGIWQGVNKKICIEKLTKTKQQTGYVNGKYQITTTDIEDRNF